MALLCLLGRHGTGKTTVGHAMQDFGIKHVSVGMLRRIAKAGHFPADIPVKLILAMKKASPARPLDAGTAQLLLQYAKSFDHCVIDGFPTSVDQLDILPMTTKFAMLWTPAVIREQRLQQRSETSVRKWTPGLTSVREDNLRSVISAINKSGKVHFVANRIEGVDAVTTLASRLAEIIRS